MERDESEKQSVQAKEEFEEEHHHFGYVPLQPRTTTERI